MNDEQVPPGTPNEEVDTNTPPQPPEAPTGGGNDINDHKALAIIGYIVPILFFIPLVTEAKSNRFAKYHANQQLNLLLFFVVGHAVATALMFILIGALLLPLIYVGGIILIVIGVINAANGEMKPLPVIGKIELIK
jgi:uncharacterized membrane protein